MWGPQGLPFMALKKEGGTWLPDGLVNDPLKPNETRGFRILVNQVPPNWNHQLPGLQIVTVTSHP